MTLQHYAPSTPTWKLQALCAKRGPDDALWFPHSWSAEAARRAKAVCAQCPVREQCLAAALDVDEPHGIWGGLTEGERRRMRATA